MTGEINKYKKIFIFGGPAVGKTTAAKRISKKYDFPLISLDKIMYDGNKKREESEMSRILKKNLASYKSWVIEGGSIGWSDQLFKESDVVIILEASLPTCLYRIIRRYIKERKYTLLSTIIFCLKILPKYYTKSLRHYHNNFHTKNVIKINTNSFDKLNSVTL